MQPEHDSGRPATDRPASVTTKDSVAPTVDRTVLQRRRWALRLISRATSPAPRYGSSEWLDLPEGDPRKVAAVVVADEAWARDGDDLEADLAAELEQARRAHKAAEDNEYQARQAAHRREWGHLRLVRGAFADSEEFKGEPAS